MSASTRDTRFSQFVEFTVDVLHMQELVTALITRAKQFTCFYPGFISAQVHSSNEGERVLMEVLWSSRADGEHALELAKTVDPDLFHLARQHHASALLFSTYHAVAEVRVSTDGPMGSAEAYEKP
ncbi:antibiotic biosynthesis monooxygenase [Pseudomonas mandelii]|uniref:antibiotic biosynthesis monooxygenase n=1 Tax=Pseudomonas mandelii TaxID=75612 RepID=UPI00209D8157|nr:antibiotic biosynthesis monooxygenase [Pseudomonas mandelii]MCO8310967.1 antibiotic biosynthesis monooxygenase [Pseudomonas mandelii]